MIPGRLRTKPESPRLNPGRARYRLAPTNVSELKRGRSLLKSTLSNNNSRVKSFHYYREGSKLQEQEQDQEFGWNTKWKLHQLRRQARRRALRFARQKSINKEMQLTRKSINKEREEKDHLSLLPIEQEVINLTGQSTNTDSLRRLRALQLSFQLGAKLLATQEPAVSNECKQ